MKNTVALILALASAFILTACSTVPKTHVNEQHGHLAPYTVSLGERHFHATMEYSQSDGGLTIRFLDENERPYKAFMAVKAKAELILPEGVAKEFYFKNARAGLTHIPSGSYRYANQAYTTHIDARENWLKDLAAFELKAWLPIDGYVYEATFVYPARS